MKAENPVPPPGDSAEQRAAETVILKELGKQLGVTLESALIQSPNGTRVQIDGVSKEPPVLCEAWAHQGPPKGGQIHKVLADAFKLTFIASLQEPRPRLILALADPEAARPFQQQTWYAEALRTLGVEIVVVDIPDSLRERVRQAQKKQER